MKNKRLSKVYRDAAKLIFSRTNIFSCDAISNISRTDDKAKLEFSKLLQPFNKKLDPMELSAHFNGVLKEYKDGLVYLNSTITDESQNHRVTALLFMSEMYK